MFTCFSLSSLEWSWGGGEVSISITRGGGGPLSASHPAGGGGQVCQTAEYDACGQSTAERRAQKSTLIFRGTCQQSGSRHPGKLQRKRQLQKSPPPRFYWSGGRREDRTGTHADACLPIDLVVCSLPENHRLLWTAVPLCDVAFPGETSATLALAAHGPALGPPITKRARPRRVGNAPRHMLSCYRAVICHPSPPGNSRAWSAHLISWHAQSDKRRDLNPTLCLCSLQSAVPTTRPAQPHLPLLLLPPDLRQQLAIPHLYAFPMV